MDFLTKDSILEAKPDTKQEVRKHFNLGKPGQIEEAVDILNKWVQMQPHFKKKDFSNAYLEISLIGCKGSIERTKSQLDKICTMRTLLPQFFGNFNIKTDFGNLYDICYAQILPKMTDDYYRIFLCKFLDTPVNASQIMDYYRGNIILAEYVKAHDYMKGFMIVLDFSEANLMEYVTKINPIELRQAMSIYIEGYGMRIRGIHIITSSKFVDAFVSIFKQVLSPKVASRIHVHRNIDDLQTFIPKHLLPKDYGGEECSSKDLQVKWINALSSEEHMDYIRDMNSAGTDETCRQTDKFNEQYAGMPGTFRLLSVD